MKKLFTIIFLGLFLISLAQASHNNYYEYYDYSHSDEIVIQKTITLHEDRFPTYDYRHGYSYRSTNEYKDRRHKSPVIRFTRSGGFHTDYDYIRNKDNNIYYVQEKSYNPKSPRIKLDIRRGHTPYYGDHTYSHNYRYVGFERADIYYEYSSHLRSYEPKECYHTEHHNKLFYKKCPKHYY